MWKAGGTQRRELRKVLIDCGEDKDRSCAIRLHTRPYLTVILVPVGALQAAGRAHVPTGTVERVQGEKWVLHRRDDGENLKFLGEP